MNRFTAQLLLADEGERGAEPLVLDNRRLRDMAQRVEGAVGELDTVVADRQPAVGVVDHRHRLPIAAFASSLGSRMNSTLSYCRVSARDSVRSSFQAKASSRLSPARSGRCRSLAFAGGLAKRLL